MSQFYIGCKRVFAWPAEKDGKTGYSVKYDDGYTSWSPADVFERAYLPMGHANTSGDRITQDMVDEFIADSTIKTLGEKTTVVHAKLENGFEMVTSSACVSAKNYNENIGAEICLSRVKDKVWELLGFLLQTALNGIKSA